MQTQAHLDKRNTIRNAVILKASYKKGDEEGTIDIDFDLVHHERLRSNILNLDELELAANHGLVEDLSQ